MHSEVRVADIEGEKWNEAKGVNRIR